jgi:probable O-glycosylation ligase (exosortase A-associated)
MIAMAAMLPAILMAPHAGILIWSWISYMNPHRMTWGFASGMPLLDSVAGLTILTWITSKERKLPPLHAISVLIIIYLLWTCLTTIFAVSGESAVNKLTTFSKIILFTIFTMVFITTKDRLRYMIYVILLGLSLYSVRGGVFTILNGGKYIVFGPSGTFLGDNNQLALAFLTIVPLFYWVYKYGEHALIRYAAAAGGILTLISVLGSHSRGALVAMAAMAAWMVVIGRRWVMGIFLGVGIIGGALMFMPDNWVERMTGIGDYQEDESANTRLYMWKYATNVANSSPIIGRGYNYLFNKDLARRYKPGNTKIFVAHSIYFDNLGEHGYVGLFLFLLLFSAAFATTSEIRSLTKDRPEQLWARDLAQMLQFSLVGFAIGGAFLSLSIFDLYYHILALTMMTHFVVLQAHVPEQTKAFSLDQLNLPGRPRAPTGLPAE